MGVYPFEGDGEEDDYPTDTVDIYDSPYPDYDFVDDGEEVSVELC